MKLSTLTRLLVPVLPIVLMAMTTGCAADVEPEPPPDQNSANITGKEAADKLGHAELVRPGIASKTPTAKVYGIHSWDVYVFDQPRADSPEKVNGVVAFGVGKDDQVRYAIVITSDQKDAVILKYDSDAVIAKYNDDTVDPSKIAQEALPSDLAKALNEERLAIKAELENQGDVLACAGNLAAALMGTAVIGGVLWIGWGAAVAGAWDVIIYGLIPTGVVPGIAAMVVVSAVDSIKSNCGGLLNR